MIYKDSGHPEKIEYSVNVWLPQHVSICLKSCAKFRQIGVVSIVIIAKSKSREVKFRKVQYVSIVIIAT